MQLISPTPEAILSAALHLKNGGLVAIPTETVYGLGADAENPSAIQKIYVAKNRPSNHPLIVHVAEISDVYHFADRVPAYAEALMQKFWPGPMTLILPRTNRSADFVTGGQDSVGLRIPDHQIGLKLLAGFKALGGHGIAAPSANRYGAVSPTTAEAVLVELGDYLNPGDQILDGGASQVGVESTIIDCTGANPVILRPGAITASEIENCTGIVVAEPGENKVRVSGSHKQHYSPRAKVFTSGTPSPSGGLIAMATVPTPAGVIRLAAPATVEEFARVLYSAMRAADDQGLAELTIIAPEGEGLALAIQDRIRRAAA